MSGNEAKIIDLAGRIWPYLKEYRNKLLLVCCGSIAVSILRLVDPYLYKIVFDDIFNAITNNAGNAYTMKRVAVSGIILFLNGIVMSHLYSYYVCSGKKVQADTDKKMRKEGQKHMQSLDMSFHNTHDSSKVMIKIYHGIGAVNNLIHDKALNVFLPGIFNITFLLGWVIYTNWQLALASIIFLPFHSYLTLRKASPIYNRYREIHKAHDEIFRRSHEDIAYISVIKDFNASEHELEKLEKNLGIAHSKQIAIDRLWLGISFYSSFFVNLAKMSTILLGTWLILNNRGTPGDLIMYLTYLGMLYQSFSDFIIKYLESQQMISQAGRFLDVMDVKPAVNELPGACDIPPVRHGIELKNVHFSYDERTEVLSGVSLHIPAGKKVAIVGPTGAGKSTLVGLIRRHYDPSEGIVMIDGTDIRKITLKSLHDRITVVPQNTNLFSRTIEENIALGTDDIDEEKIIEAATIANAHQFISKKPDGYKSMAGENGVRLSGGEKQRICIARAALKNASVIIMDEATSSLDSGSEAIVQEALWKLIRGKTAIIIAHRLSTILHSDLIVVMENGKIIDQGTSDELLARCELYKKLYNLQFRIEESKKLEEELALELSI